MEKLRFDIRYIVPIVVILDFEGNIIDGDSHAAYILGDNFVGMNFAELLDDESRKIFGTLINDMLSGKESKTKFSLNFKNSEISWEVEAFKVGEHIVLRIENVAHTNNVDNILNILSSSIDNILEMVMITDADGKIVYVNPAFTRVTGYSLEEIIGKSPSFLNSGLYDKNFYSNICSTVSRGNIWHGEIVNRKKNGELYHEEMTIVPVVGKSGKVEYMVALKYDITDRKIKERELERRSELLSTLYNISLEMGGFPDIEYISARIHNELRKVISFKSFLVGIYDKSEDVVRIIYGKSGSADMKGIVVKCDPKSSLAGRAVKSKKSLLIRDLSKEFRPGEYIVAGPKRGNVMEKSAMFVPILYREKVIGLMVVSTEEPNAYDEEELRYVEIIANSLGIFLENYNLFKKIKETKELYETLINTTLAGIGITDSTYHLTFVNEMLAKMLGYSTEDMIGKSVFEFTTEETKKVMLKQYARRLKGISDTYEARLKRKDGSFVDFLVNASPLKDNNGNVIGTLAVAIDITERKKWEKRVKEEWEKYRTAMENVLVGIAILYDSKIIFVNHTMVDMLGYKEEDLLNKNFLKIVYPDMRDLLWSNYERRMRGEPIPDTYIAKLMDSNGNPRWCIVRGTIVEWEGKKVDMMSAQDITPLKDMENKLLALVNMFEKINLKRSEEEIYELVINTITEILNFKNVVVTQIFENGVIVRRYKGMENAVNLNNRVIVNEGIVGWVAKHRKSYYASDVSKDPYYVKVNPTTKSEYATPIIFEDRLFGVLNVESERLDGISENDRRLIDLVASHLAVALAGLEYQKNLEKIKEFHEMLLHIVSHDLKNPLAVLQGYLELAKDEPSPEFFESMESAIEEAQDIINKARLFSKLGVDKIEAERQKVSLEELLNESIELISKKYPNGEIRNFVKDIEITGFHLIKDAFVNILDNAFKYGASKVDITSEESERIVEVKISDDGPGIPKEKRDLIFEPFKRLHSGEGSGLGLSIVKMIMELHGGSIEIEDNKPKGSTFVLRIPKYR